MVVLNKFSVTYCTSVTAKLIKGSTTLSPYLRPILSPHNTAAGMYKAELWDNPENSALIVEISAFSVCLIF